MKKQQSIQRRLHSSYLFIVGLLSVPTIVDLSGARLESELWDIVAGNQAYQAGAQEHIMDEISTRLDRLLYETEIYESRQQVEAAVRLVDTMSSYMEELGAPSYRHSVMYSNEQILREIRSVSDLLHTVLQEYIFIEIGVISDINGQLRSCSIAITFLAALLLLVIIMAAVDSCRSVQRDIREPIGRLEAMSVQLAAGNLEARAAPPSVSELDTLTRSLNTMADQLDELIENRIADQRSLRKAEMRTLQAQITPHFIYNTLDTIVWLAQQKENQAVVDITMALTQFFRISLSGGSDYITVGQELSHVESYLKIQAVRYESIMQYRIDVEASLAPCPILKLLLQPLVENAIYHGIKKKRGRGLITVTGRRNPDQTMTFSVSDTGIGMPAERLAEVRAALTSDAGPQAGFGLYNVNQRIRLYYNNSGLDIQSAYRSGTTISFTIPCRMD